MNDNTAGRSSEARKALILGLVPSLGPGAEAKAVVGAIYRELEALAPGSLDRAHARHQAKRLGLSELPDLSRLDWPATPDEGRA